MDLGPQSAAVLASALALQKAFEATLTLMHAVPAGASMAKGSETNWNVVVRKAAEEELEKLLDTSQARAQLLIESGDPAQVVSAAAHGLGANLVVIGRGSAAGVFGRLRTNAYALIRQSPCPVVSV